jgi:PAS domain S-box-containing protein
MDTAGRRDSAYRSAIAHPSDGRAGAPIDPPNSAPNGAPNSIPIDAALGAAFQRSVLAMFVVDLDLVIVRANPAAALLVGTADLVGRSYTDFHSASSAAQARRFVARLHAGELDHVHREGVMISATGDHLVVDLRSEPLPEIAGPAMYLVQVRDVTALRQHERALTAGERMYRDVVEHLPNSTVLSFDREMRVLLVAGALIERLGYDPTSMRGQRMPAVLPDSVMAEIIEPVQAALRGESSDLDYSSPVNGKQFRMRVQPITADDDRIVGGLILSEDVSAERARQMQLEQMQELSRVGSCRFDAASGWDFDPVLLDLLGVDTAEEGLVAVDELVLPEDRERIRSTYRRVLADGGRATIEYRLRQGRTGELRYVRGSCDAVVDSDGKLLRAVLTHADITESVYSRRTAEAALAASAQARTVLLRRISDLLATDRGSLLAKAEQIAEVAAAGLGDGALLRIMTADGLSVESDTVAHPDPVLRATLKALVGTSVDGSAPPRGSAAGTIGNGTLLAGSDPWMWAEIHRLPGAVSLEGIVAHFIAAPVRHAGQVLGILSVFRAAPDKPFVAGDEDLVQVLADRVGAAIDESRMQEWLEQQRRERQAITGRLLQLTTEQRELLDQLSEVEERERVLLAEAIHDDPMQLVIAVAMRLEIMGLKSNAFGDEIGELVDLLESAVERLRTLITALSPPDLAGGLGPALRRLAEGIFIGTPTQVHSTSTALVALSPEHTDAAFRIFREALVNARKHAQATNVDLTVRQEDSRVVITLSDDGVGTDSFDAGPGHLGMMTMRARAATAGGLLSVRSRPGQGTTVTLTITADASAPPARNGGAR